MVRRKNLKFVKAGIQIFMILIILMSSSTVFANIDSNDNISLTDANDDTSEQDTVDDSTNDNNNDEESNNDDEETTTNQNVDLVDNNDADELATNNTLEFNAVQKVFVGVVVVDDAPETNVSFEEISGEPVTANIYLFTSQLFGGTFTKIEEITLTYLPYPNMFYGGKYLWWNGSGTLTVGYSPTNYINELSVIEASVGGLVTVHHWECKVGLIASGGDVEDEEIQLEYLDIPNIITNIPNISYTRASISPPVAHFTYTPSSPHVGTYITFNGSSSYDPDGEIIYYLWAYRPANSSAWPTMMCNSTDQPVIQYKWDTAGNYEVILVVIDNNNLTDRMTTTIRIPFKPSIFNILPTNLEDRLLKRI